MKAVLLLTIFVALAVARTESEYRSLFKDFKAKYNKQYDSNIMETTRFEIFKLNVDFIDNFNTEAHNFTVAINSFADMTNEEFRAVYLGYKMPVKKVHKHHVLKPGNVAALPASVDWVKAGAVTHIKNQGQCGSCWSFSTTGSVEGCVEIATKQLVCLSEQNLVDCSSAEGNEGCDGGLMDDAFQYIITNGGIDSESEYPYTAETGTSCNYTPKDDSATITSFTDVTSGSESALQTAVVQQPVSVAIDASQSSFQFYSSGVYSDPNCSTSQLDHGVLAVGYGTDATSGSAYWYVKNSWGTDWGMAGYIWMARNDGNMCGIATAASFPTGCKTSMKTGHGC